MAFKFSNMQTFVRNCFEPHMVALSTLSKSRFNELLERLLKMDKEHLELLEQQNKYLKDEIAKLILEVNIKIASVTTIEVGWVGIWPSYQTPSDGHKWLLCNGSSYSQNTYPELYRILQSTSLPDYRGYFLRGVGGNSASLGQAQGDAIRNIKGGYTPDVKTFGQWGVVGQPASGAQSSGNWGGGGGAGFIFDASTVVPTAEENRPINKAVQYFIRAIK